MGETLRVREPWKLWKCLKSSSVLWICWLSWVLICFLSHVHNNVNSKSLLSARQITLRGFSGCSVIKDPLANSGDERSIPRSGRSPGEGNGNLLQYTCLENPMDRGAWQTRVHGVAKSQPQLSTHKSKKKGGLDFKRIHTCYSLRWDPSNDTLWSLPEGSTQRRLNTQL